MYHHYQQGFGGCTSKVWYYLNLCKYCLIINQAWVGYVFTLLEENNAMQGSRILVKIPWWAAPPRSRQLFPCVCMRASWTRRLVQIFFFPPGTSDSHWVSARGESSAQRNQGSYPRLQIPSPCWPRHHLIFGVSSCSCFCCGVFSSHAIMY